MFKSLGKFSVKVLKVLGFTVLGLFSLLVLLAIFAPKPPKIPVNFSSYLVENDLGGKCDASLLDMAKVDNYVAGWKKATSPSLNKNWTYIAPFYVYKTTVNYKNDKGFVEHPAACKFNEKDLTLSSRYDEGRITYFKKTPIVVVTPVADLTIVKAYWDNEGYGFHYIRGIVKNNTDRDLSFVTVSYTVYDEGGSVVSTANDIIATLRAGRTWKFKAIVITENSNVSKYTYELDSLNGI